MLPQFLMKKRRAWWLLPRHFLRRFGSIKYISTMPNIGFISVFQPDSHASVSCNTVVWQFSLKAPRLQQAYHVNVWFGDCPASRVLEALRQNGSLTKFLDDLYCQWWQLLCRATCQLEKSLVAFREVRPPFVCRPRKLLSVLHVSTIILGWIW